MQEISFKDFCEMPDDNKWQFVWNILTNHFHQIKEMKWVLRLMAGSMGAYFIKLIWTGLQAPK